MFKIILLQLLNVSLNLLSCEKCSECYQSQESQIIIKLGKYRHELYQARQEDLEIPDEDFEKWETKAKISYSFIKGMDEYKKIVEENHPEIAPEHE